MLMTLPGPCSTFELSQQIRDVYPERLGDEQEVVDEGRVGPVLEPVDGLPVEADALGELLLGELAVEAGGAGAAPYRPAALEHPLGDRVDWHPFTL